MSPTNIATSAIAPLEPYVVVLFGATGDPARGELLPGLRLTDAGLMPDVRIVGASLDPVDDDGSRALARASWPGRPFSLYEDENHVDVLRPTRGRSTTR